MSQAILDSPRLRAVSSSSTTIPRLLRRSIRIQRFGTIILSGMAFLYSSRISGTCWANRTTRHPATAAFGLVPLVHNKKSRSVPRPQQRRQQPQQQFNSRRWYHSTTLAVYKKTSRPINDGSNQELTWETFEFSQSPKFDKRFSAATILSDPSSSSDGVVMDHRLVRRNSDASTDDAETSKQYSLERLHQLEAQQDVLYQKQQHQQLEAWTQLDSDLVQRATAILLTLVQRQRVHRIDQVLRQRTAHTRFLFENPSNPSNVWACLRTIESFGVQHVDVILQSDRYAGKAALHQKRGMRTAMGAAQWLTLRNHASTAHAIEYLRHQQPGIRIWASDLNPQARDIRNVDWDGSVDDNDPSSRNRPICIVMGNEEHGISDEMRELADATFTLPMVGFAESFNLSVATAITCAHLSAASSCTGSVAKGPLRPGDLPEHQYRCLMLKGLLNSLPQKRMADAVLKQAGIALPKSVMDLL